MPRTVKATCTKCKGTFTLNIGGNILEKAIKILKQKQGFECTAGKHVEPGSPMFYRTIHPETPHQSNL
jgi:hypothetical protein